MESKQKKPAARRLVKLFFSMLYISAFTFGGGFVIVTLMKRKFVDELHWMTEEMLDIAAMAQSSPGAIAVNAANLVGWRVGGFAGMLTSVIATIIPPMAILTVISIFYAAFASNPYVSQALRGMQAGVAAVILDVVYGLGIKEFHSHSALRLCILGAAFIAAFVLDVNVIYIILATALVGVISALAARKRGGAK